LREQLRNSLLLSLNSRSYQTIAFDSVSKDALDLSSEYLDSLGNVMVLPDCVARCDQPLLQWRGSDLSCRCSPYLCIEGVCSTDPTVASPTCVMGKPWLWGVLLSAVIGGGRLDARLKQRSAQCGPLNRVCVLIVQF
jgi:hypothetical protein